MNIRETFTDAAKDAKEKIAKSTGELKEVAEKGLNELAESAKESAKDAAKVATEKMKKVSETAKETSKDVAKDAAKVATEKVKKVTDIVTETVKKTVTKEDFNKKLYIQYWGKQLSEDDIYKRFKEVWTQNNKLSEVEDLKLYFKLEESKVYCVVNGEIMLSFKI